MCEKQPSEQQIEGAKGAYRAGTVSFQEADYERAILYWEDAFRRDCTAAKLLLNLARAYELAGHREHALLALETFLERRPETQDRASIEKRISYLRVEVDRQRVVTAESDAEAARRRAEQAQRTAESEGDGERRPAWPVILTATGVATGATGLVLFFTAQATLDSVNCVGPYCSGNPDTGTTAEEESNRALAAQELRNLGGGLAIAGGALTLGGGLAWYFLWKGKSGTEPLVTPIAAPGLLALSVRGRF